MIKSLFNDNEMYGVADINNVFTHLTSGGVVSVSDSIVTAVLESGVAQFAESGVEFHNPNACRVIKDSRGYIVSNGSAFMPDGSIVTVSEDGEKVSGIVSGNVNYVFFQRSSEKNGTYVSASTVLPSDKSNILMLAEIDESGNITDKREYATTKLIPSSGNIYPVRNVNIQTKSDGSGTGQRFLLATCNIGWNAYKYIRVIFQYYRNGQLSTEEDEIQTTWIDMQTGTSIEIYTKVYGNGMKFEFKKDGENLEIYQTWSNDVGQGSDGLLEIMFV